MTDGASVPVVTALRLDFQTLLIEYCPFCGHNHWHAVRGCIYDDIRESNCKQSHLRKKLRGKRLYYRLHHERGTPDHSEIIRFPTELRELARMWD